MERLDDIFTEFEEKLDAEKRAAKERQERQEAEAKRAFEVGRHNLQAVVVPVLATLVLEAQAKGQEFKFFENNGGSRPMIAVTLRVKSNGVLLSQATSSLVFESWGLSLYCPNSQILNLPSNSTPSYLKSSEHHTQSDVRRAVVSFIKDVLKTLHSQLG